LNDFIAVNCKGPEEGRGEGRPRAEWEEYVEGLVRKRRRKLPEVRRLAQDRDEYRKWLLKQTFNSKRE
jgi:hypothetical protein